jgi:UDP-N-acetylmuramoyl-tripeptide--D-alanyl-D-alanine ligase
VAATAANNNNHVGVPLTIFEADETTEALIIEHGANHFGEIEYTANIAEPDYALVTNVGPSHLEFFKDERGVLKEKRALLDAAIAAGGKALVNLDDPWLAPLAKEFPDATTFGEHEDARVRLLRAELTSEGKPRVVLEYEDERLEVALPVYGSHNAKNFLAAASFALLAGLTFEDVRVGAAKTTPTKGRLVVERVGDCAIVDDAYNANPNSTRAAFALVSRMEGYRRRIAILGDMFELGERAKAMHRDLLAPMRDAGFDEALLLGEDMKTLAEAANDPRVRWAATKEELEEAIGALDLRGAVVLVKGSRGMRMEDFIPALKRRRNALSSL